MTDDRVSLSGAQFYARSFASGVHIGDVQGRREGMIDAYALSFDLANSSAEAFGVAAFSAALSQALELNPNATPVYNAEATLTTLLELSDSSALLSKQALERPPGLPYNPVCVM